MKIEFKDNIPYITPETNKEEDQLFDWYEKYKGKRMNCCMSLNWVERAVAETTKREQANELLPLVMPRISYAEDWQGNKYEPCEINCKLDDEGKISFETKEVFGLGDVPIDLEPEYET